jgi:hypothetical protein
LFDWKYSEDDMVDIKFGFVTKHCSFSFGKGVRG